LIADSPFAEIECSEMKIAGTDESYHANHDQVKGDDEIQQPGHDKNQNSGDQ
jgi:hypothetical protein